MLRPNLRLCGLLFVLTMLLGPDLALSAGVALPGGLGGLPGLGGAGGGMGAGLPGGASGGLGAGAIPGTPGSSPPPLLGQTLGTANDATNGVAAPVKGTVDSVGREPQPTLFETDPAGARIVKSEVLALSPSLRGLAAARNLNFDVVRQENLGPLGLGVTVLRAPQGMSAPEALNALRAADPAGTYDFNHVYDPSGEIVSSAPATGLREPVSAERVVIGLIDGGIDRMHPALKGAHIVSFNPLSSESPPTAHGTAIASVLVSTSARAKGAVPGATIYAADVFGGKADGGAADAVLAGLSWLAERGVPVVNISLVGPPNRTVEVAIRALLARGVVVVAAVGNNGPSAPVGFPAAYDGVIAVTSVDAGRHIQVDACRGHEVMFAARGVAVPVAAPGGEYGSATGTSFAAPLVAARFALLLQRPNVRAVADITRGFEAAAVDLGAPGRDPVYGFGFLESPSGGEALTSR